MADGTIDGATVRLTYAELAAARGISLDSARRMTLRRGWSKQIGNDGLTRVDVPAAALTGASTDVGGDAGAGDSAGAGTDTGRTGAAPPIDEETIAAIAAAVAATTDARTDILLAAATGDTRRAINALEEAMTALRSQLASERERADLAESRLREMRSAMDEQTAEHRRIVEALVARIPQRRAWWLWRRAK